MVSDPRELASSLELAYKTIQRVNGLAYKDLFLISNQVLSKNPYTNNYLKKIVFNVPAVDVSLTEVFKKVAAYYLHSIISLIVNFITFLSFHVCCNKTRYSFRQAKELVLVDTFFLTDNILKKEKFEDIYFPGIEDVLRKINKTFAYLPVFYGDLNPFSVKSVFKILIKDKIAVLCEYKLLRVIDYISLLYFVLIYPFHVIGLTRKIKDKKRESQLLVEELLRTLDQVTWYGYLRYLVGKRISQLPCERIKIISWYENQVIDKNLYKGLRQKNNKSTIYGAQLFLYTKIDLNVPADENEGIFGLIPDKILVNGAQFIPETNDRVYDVGPSLRYRELFSSKVSSVERDSLLVVLPYQKEDAEHILRMVIDADITRYKVVIKEHPAHSGYLESRVAFEKNKSNYVFSDDNIYDLFRRTKIVIGATSGGLLEAAAMAIPAILIRNLQGLDNNILPEYGRGVIWDEVVTAIELKEEIEHFLTMLEKEYENMVNVASKYKKLFFCEPTEQKIIEAFDLIP